MGYLKRLNICSVLREEIMPQEFNKINDTITSAFDSDSILNVLIDFEGVLDHLDIYAYENWEKGEVIQGPDLEKYWVTVTLMYPKKLMPNPDGALRIIERGGKVMFGEDTYLKPIKVSSHEDMESRKKPFTDSDAKQEMRPKLIKIPVWLVKITLPRKFVNSQSSEKIRVSDTELDLDAVTSAYDQNLDQEEALQDNNPQSATRPENPDEIS